MTFVDDIEMKDYAFTLLDIMSEADRILVELYYFEGLKYKEIGKKFEVCGARVSQALKDILKELRRVVSRLDIRKEVKWRSVVTNKSILYNHRIYSRNKLIKKRKEQGDARNAFDGNTHAFEQWCLEHYRSQWKYRIKNGLYVHPRFRRLYYKNLKLFKDA